MRNIAIVAPLGAGKTSVANIISDIMLRGYRCPLTTVGMEVIRTLNYHAELPVREAKQRYYEACRDIFGQHCFAAASDDKIAEAVGSLQYGYGIIDDVRASAEMEYLKSKGYLTIGIQCDRDNRALRLLARDGYDQKKFFDAPKEVEAEALVPQCDIVIDNNGTYGELIDKVTSIVRAHFMVSK